MTDSNQVDRTAGVRSPIVQDALAVMRIAWPLIISNIFFTAQILIDRLLLSWYSSDCMAAAGAASMIGMTPIQLLQHTALFATTFVAQYVGANRPHQIGPLVNQTVLFAIISGLLFMTLIPWAGSIIAWVGHDSRLLTLETQYLECLGFTALPITLTAAFSSFFAGRGDTRTIIWIQATGMLVNAVLDYVLIFGKFGFPELGIRGAGWGTVAGCWASAITGLGLYLRPRFASLYQTHSEWTFHGSRMGRLLKFGIPNGMMATLDMSTWMLFTIFVGWLGPAALAATMLVFNVNAAFLIPMLGIGQAVSVLVGQRLGANQPERAEQAAWIGLFVAEIFMMSAALVVAFTPEACLWLFQPREMDSRWREVVEYVPTLLIFVAFYTFFDCLCITLGYALRGAGDTRFVTAAAALIGFLFLVLPTYFICQQGWSLYWAWGAIINYLLIQAAVFMARFCWGPWRSMRVIEPSSPVALDE